MLLLLLLVTALAGRGLALRVVFAVPCPAVAAVHRYAARGGPIDALLVVDSLPTRPLTRMELYRTARELAANATERAVVVTDCASGLVGLAFARFLVGMDCSSRRVDEIMGDVDAVDPADSQPAKLAHLLARLERWDQEQACRPVTDRWQVLGAALFWAPLVAVALWFTTGRDA